MEEVEEVVEVVVDQLDFHSPLPIGQIGLKEVAPFLSVYPGAS